MSHGPFSKPWEELEFYDNFIFCKVMQNEELCTELLEILLGIQIEKIEYLKTENQLENFYDSKGVRLDVYVKDSTRIFDIEIQTGNYSDLLMRSRYYQAASDVATTKRRTKFKDLKETYIIFICKDDPFGLGLPRYTKQSKFLETDELPYDDKTHHVFYNCSAWEKEQNKEVREVLKFISSFKADTLFTQKLETAAGYAKANSLFKDEYMYLEDVIEEEKEIAREEGRVQGLSDGRELGLSEGREQGINQKARETAVALLKLGKLSLEEISNTTGIPIELVRELAENN